MSGRIPIFPSEGHILKHKERDEYARILYLGAGASIDDYTEITEEEYKSFLELRRQEELDKWSI